MKDDVRREKQRKKTHRLTTVLLLACSTGTFILGIYPARAEYSAVYAAEAENDLAERTDLMKTVDLSRADCSLTLFPLQYGDTGSGKMTLLSDGIITLYFVSDLIFADGQYKYDLSTGQFAGTDGIDNLTYRIDTENQEIAKILNAHRSGKTGSACRVSEGRVQFNDLSPGLYLVVMSEAGEEDVRFEPYLVSIPQVENGKWIYQITAEPKPLLTGVLSGGGTIQSENHPEEGSKEKETHSKNDKDDGSMEDETQSGRMEGGFSDSGIGSSLPRTGQVWWPCRLLFALGAGLLTAGNKRKS